MSYQIYVGNYPDTFSETDVINLFRDFEDISLLRYFKKNKKCYSFLKCISVDQVAVVVQKMNNIVVDGRVLIVRATDDKLQNYVNLLLQNAEEAHLESSEIPAQVLRNKSVYRRKGKYNEDQFEKDSHKSMKSSSSSMGGNSLSDTKFDGASSNVSDIVDEFYVDTTDKQESEFSWVSVTNFPLYTTIRDIYDLFSDFNPLEIKMICNMPKRDRTITEAYVCFENQDIANDVILTFDNTLLHRRVILVNDIEDLTILNELLDINH